jgi:hypothetical protein
MCKGCTGKMSNKDSDKVLPTWGARSGGDVTHVITSWDAHAMYKEHVGG